MDDDRMRLPFLMMQLSWLPPDLRTKRLRLGLQAVTAATRRTARATRRAAAATRAFGEAFPER